MTEARVMTPKVVVVPDLGADTTTDQDIRCSHRLDFLDIEVTERCNLCCIPCYIRRPLADNEAASREMSARKVGEILNEASLLGCKGVRFSGGEPLARKDFADIYLRAFSSGLGLELATNATLVSGEFTRMLAEHRPRSVSVSIYGWDEASYDQTVGVLGSFAKFMTGVQLLKKHDITLHLQYPPVKHLVRNSEKIRKLARELGILSEVPYTWELVMHARHEPNACGSIKLLRLSPEEAAEEMLKESNTKEHFQQAIKQRKVFTGRIFPCNRLKWRPAVDAYGQLQICLMLRHPETRYDLLSGSLADAIEHHLSGVRSMTTTNEEYLARCGVCAWRSACLQCPASSWTECGVLDQPADYYCKVTHAVVRLLENRVSPQL